jgi:hypothetical protein
MINTSTATCRFSCFCSAQFHDDVGRVLERDQLATVGQHDRLLEWSAPALWSLKSLEPDRSNIDLLVVHF